MFTKHSRPDCQLFPKTNNRKNKSMLDFNSNEDEDFSSNLCKFLSTLSTTTETDFSSINPQMAKLRETLIEKAARKEYGKYEKHETLMKNAGNIIISVDNSNKKNTTSTYEFSSELCKFLSTLSTTTGSDFSSLNPHMAKLRKTLIEQVAKKEYGKYEKLEMLRKNVGNINISLDNSTSSGASNVNVSVDDSTVNGTVGNIKDLVDNSMKQNIELVFSVQSGAGYELVDNALEVAFSQYGEVTNVQIEGGRGSLKFKTEKQAKAALNKLVQVGDCTVHTSLPRNQFSSVPVPFQVLVDPCHFPRCWERTSKIKAFFTKYGEVLAIDWVPGQTRAVISFKDLEVAQKLIGREFLLCPSIQEVSTKTMEGLLAF